MVKTEPTENVKTVFDLCDVDMEELEIKLKQIAEGMEDVISDFEESRIVTQTDMDMAVTY